jgi:Kef-type K+ transport system membrane component KefB/mannitol/fructose-specific phosphotransferase system IIA component (Ntr-type)
MYMQKKRFFLGLFIFCVTAASVFAEGAAGAKSINDSVALFVLQLGIILFMVRFFGKLAKKAGMSQVLGELLAGIIIGPYALGGIQLPGFPEGIFPLNSPSLAVSNELFVFASVASIILLFVTGLETNIGLFLRYSLAGGIIGIGGVLASFAAGDLVGVLLLRASFMDPRCLFLGMLATATSLGIAARVLSDKKMMDSPEGVTILAAAVFDDVLSIIGLAVVLGVVAVVTGHAEAGGGLSVPTLLAIAGKAFGIWLGFTALALIFSKQLAGFLKLFRRAFDFSIMAMGVALILSGVFEKQGLAMIIGAYIAGLSLSKTDIAAVVKDRIRGLYEFFVPVFFAVMGMMVNVREIISPPVLAFGAAYSAALILSKIVGCGGPALLLGFNARGALRIGTGMVSRCEVTLIIAGIGLALGVLTGQLFAAVILMVLITTLAAPPLLSVALKLAGPGTRKPARSDNSVSLEWKFSSAEIADLVTNALLKDLRGEGFYVQLISMDKGLSQARKDDIVLSISGEENVVTIETSRADMLFVKTAVYEVIVRLGDSIQKLRESSDPELMKQELLDTDGGARGDLLLSRITPECISLNLAGQTKKEIITELVDILAAQGRLLDRDIVLKDVLERENIMSTSMQRGIALPHAKTGGTDDLAVAVGVKKEGVDFESVDGELSRLFILTISPKKISGPHVQFLAAISALLKDDAARKAVIDAASPEIAAELLSLRPVKI